MRAGFDQQVEVTTAPGRIAQVDLLEFGPTEMAAETSELAAPTARDLGTSDRETVEPERPRRDGRSRRIREALDTKPEPGTEASLFENVAAVHGQEVEWETALLIVVAEDQLQAWLGVDEPLLALDLVGVARTGELL